MFLLIHSDVAFDPDNKSPRWDASKPLIHITEKSVTPLLEMAEQTIYIDKIDIFYCRQHWPISLVICSRQLKIRQNFENTYFNEECRCGVTPCAVAADIGIFLIEAHWTRPKIQSYKKVTITIST